MSTAWRTSLGCCACAACPGPGAVSAGPLPSAFCLSCPCLRSRPGSHLGTAPLHVAPSFAVPMTRGPLPPSPRPPLLPAKGGGDARGNSPNRLPLATGAGGGAGTRARGLPAGDPEARGAAPPGSPAATAGSLRQRRKSARPPYARPCLWGAVLCAAFKKSFTLKPCFAFHVHENDHGCSWMVRCECSVLVCVCASSVCFLGAAAPRLFSA